jgi:hypothetical protein
LPKADKVQPIATPLHIKEHNMSRSEYAANIDLQSTSSVPGWQKPSRCSRKTQEKRSVLNRLLSLFA